MYCNGILPFRFRDFDSISTKHDDDERGYANSLSEEVDYEPDIVIRDNHNVHYIDLVQKVYSTEIIDQCNEANVPMYYIYPNWILQQKTTPTCINHVLITNPHCYYVDAKKLQHKF